MESKEEWKFLDLLKNGIPLTTLCENKGRNPAFPHAPVRRINLTESETALALKNALRYFPVNYHSVLKNEFATELKAFGHIYMYRFTPSFPIRAYPFEAYPAKCDEAKAIMLMIMNNLDPAVAQYPQELVTYGDNGQVFSNWAQFWLMMQYLTQLERDQTLVIMSGHPMGLFPSTEASPRLVITNGMMVPNYSGPADYYKYFALGVTQYGQMTAGSYCYIGPQGIVHGTTITLLNACRKYLRSNDLSGKVFLTSGLGGMSGAQGKAAMIAGCIGIIAEVNWAPLKKRYDQGWVKEIICNENELIKRVKEARQNKESTSIAFHGNIVKLWERFAQEYLETGNLLVELGSDQTSLHNPYNGGYYPVSLSYDEAQEMMDKNPEKFKREVKQSLLRQIDAIRKLTLAGLKFWDYGNAFLLECSRAGADIISKEDTSKFIYPSYVEDIMGDIFSLGFGPFRWVCCSSDPCDLERTDQAAIETFEEIIKDLSLSDDTRGQYEQNLKWIREAQRHKLVVGSQARILYSDSNGRVKLAMHFNRLIKSGKLKGPVVLSRDHHDVSGTDSPYRETANLTDGSKYTADMAVQNFIGDGVRGATWVALHNGGGVGWGEVINGGFGLLLTGSNSDVAENLLFWDVNNGVARRAWSGNKFAIETIQRAMELNPRLKVTIPNFF